MSLANVTAFSPGWKKFERATKLKRLCSAWVVQVDFVKKKNQAKQKMPLPELSLLVNLTHCRSILSVLAKTCSYYNAHAFGMEGQYPRFAYVECQANAGM